MGKNKYGTCPYCNFTGELVWYEQEYVCQECKLHFSEDDQSDKYNGEDKDGF
jgi:DNA-directed RNA polymerase subunit RPC12/RpoP